MSVYSDPAQVNSPTVALLGTGLMGAAMARNVMGAGMSTRVWNRTVARADPLAASGATVCHTAAEAVDGADVVVTMLWDAVVVEQSLRDAAERLAAGTVLLQTSTVGAEGADRLGEVAAELGLRYVDAPVLGSRRPAEQGALVVLASGPGDLRGLVAPVLDAIGSRTLWVGEAGAGSRLKLATNAFVLTLTGAVAQSLALTRSFGLEPALFLDAISGGHLESPFVATKGRAMTEGDFEASFTVAGGLKDAELIVRDAEGSAADLVGCLLERQRRVVEAGHGDEDLAAVYRDYSA